MRPAKAGEHYGVRRLRPPAADVKRLSDRGHGPCLHSEYSNLYFCSMKATLDIKLLSVDRNFRKLIDRPQRALPLRQREEVQALPRRRRAGCARRPRARSTHRNALAVGSAPPRIAARDLGHRRPVVAGRDRDGRGSRSRARADADAECTRAAADRRRHHDRRQDAPSGGRDERRRGTRPRTAPLLRGERSADGRAAGAAHHRLRVPLGCRRAEAAVNAAPTGCPTPAASASVRDPRTRVMCERQAHPSSSTAESLRR